MDIEPRARDLMIDKGNCARTVVLAVSEALNVPVPPGLEAATTFLRGGLSCGCMCGALSGAVLLSGYLHSLHPHPLGDKLGAHLHDLFKETFGSTCCRAVKAKRPLHLRLSKKPCQDLTARFAVLVYEVWQEVIPCPPTDD